MAKTDKTPAAPRLGKISASITDESTGDAIMPDSFEPKAGEYHLVKLDIGGNEIEGSDFSVGVNTFNNSFKVLTEGEMPSYKVKKKAH